MEQIQKQDVLQLKAWIHGKQPMEVRNYLSTLMPADIAMLFEDLEEEERLIAFRILPKELAADAFVYFDNEIQEDLIQAFNDVELKEVFEQVFLDDTVNIIEEMPANVVKRILRSCRPERRKMINELLQYPEESVGSLMTIEYIALRGSMTVRQAIDKIRKTGMNKEMIYTCYVVDDQRHLEGLLSIRDLLNHTDETPIEMFMETNVISIGTHDDQEQAAQMLSKYDFLALPVVDYENRLVGIVTIDDAVDVLQEENTEDMEIMAAIAPSDHPYLKTTPLEMWGKRIPWLLFLMLSATFTGMIISNFEDKLAAYVALTAFIPMLMGTGGNSGGQASVMITRGLSLGEIEISDLPKVIWKEFRVGILCGVTLAIANFGKMLLVDRYLMHNPDITILVITVVSLTILVEVIAAKIVGCILPIAAKRLGLDPAVMASPFITTIVDALSLLIYFQLAVAILHI